MKMFTFTVNFPYFKSNFLGIIRENVCVIAEIPRICMRERNQNRLSILSGLGFFLQNTVQQVGYLQDAVFDSS